ncbi:PepSY-associated TM helix domain-containing protein [Paucibacter sp. APW11]|uniref:PepSY-associated TM helix domain-containing protein n=1 Tax=Roseateles aquae TaxID=3077235 RepID=A0ABU3P947_9BURK|nr:PepSY-associated TM helix domain-containing protein [Paucibacter sp. APW11]MDT8998603.1 PepSY-associated TM helix domain-containing protein [Paucibacter sp. APW11]
MKLKSETLRIYKAVHGWTGLLSGLALFIAFYAGAFTLFKAELDDWLRPAQQQQAVQQSLDELGALLPRLLREQPAAARELRLDLQGEGVQRRASLSWQAAAGGVGGDGDEDDEGEGGAADRRRSAHLDAAGQLQLQTLPAAMPLGRFVDDLHRVVGLPVDNDVCRWLMGVIAALYALALFSGLVLVLPTLAKDFLALRLGKNLKRLWLDAHNAVGVASLPFHLVMAVTAVVFAVHDGLYALQDRWLHQSQLQGRPAVSVAAPPPDLAQMLSPQQLVARAEAEAPGLRIEQLQYQQLLGPRPLLRVWGHDERAVSPRARGGFLALDPYSGRVLNRDFLPGQQGAAALIISSAFALHMASFGGTEVRWMYFLLALAGAWLFYSGNLLWIESRRKRAVAAGEALQTRGSRVMAALSVGVSLGCIAALSGTLLGLKLQVLCLPESALRPAALYYPIFLACLGWSVWRGAARAALPVLRLAVVLSLAIPLLGLCEVVIGLAVFNKAWVVEATVLPIGLALAAMARATARRCSDHGQPSVWSAPVRGG